MNDTHPIRLRRKQNILSLDQLADATGLSAGLLSYIENGKRVCSRATILAVAKALGITVETLRPEVNKWEAERPKIEPAEPVLSEEI